jgi:hypothetical protein
MKITLRLLLLIAILAIVPRVALAQSANPLTAPIPPNRIGADVGLNLNSMAGSFQSDCGCEFTTGSGNAVIVGAVAETHLTRRVALVGRIAMDQRVLNSKQDIVGPQPVFNVSTNRIDTVQATLNESATTRWTYVTITPMIRLDILHNLFVAAGPAVGLAISSNQHVDESIGGGYSFLDQTSTRIIQDGAIANSTALRIALDGLIGFEFDVSPKFTLVPQVAFDMPLTSLSSANSAWKMTTIQVLMGIRWRFHV